MRGLSHPSPQPSQSVVQLALASAGASFVLALLPLASLRLRPRNHFSRSLKGISKLLQKFQKLEHDYFISIVFCKILAVHAAKYSAVLRHTAQIYARWR